jgi:hypothetical protein
VSAFIDERRGDFGVELICATLEVSASAYYQRATGVRSARAVEDERLLGVIRKTHASNYEAYGSRRMWKALRRAGEEVGRGHVERLMSTNAICGAKQHGKALQNDDRWQRPDRVTRSRQPRLHRVGAEPHVGGGFHVHPLLGGRRVLQLRPGRLLAASGRLAVRRAHAYRARSRRPRHGRRRAPRRPRRCAGSSLRPRLARRNQPVVATPRRGEWRWAGRRDG